MAKAAKITVTPTQRSRFGSGFGRVFLELAQEQKARQDRDQRPVAVFRQAPGRQQRIEPVDEEPTRGDRRHDEPEQPPPQGDVPALADIGLFGSQRGLRDYVLRDARARQRGAHSAGQVAVVEYVVHDQAVVERITYPVAWKGLVVGAIFAVIENIFGEGRQVLISPEPIVERHRLVPRVPVEAEFVIAVPDIAVDARAH
jgi:hypothetical protein